MRVTWLLCVLIAAMAAVPSISNAQYNLPPAELLRGPGPGVGGPGPGVLAPATYNMPAAVPAAQTTAQLLFTKPEGMQVRWDVGAVGMFDSSPLVVPGRNDFTQGGIYRLKVTNLPGREGVELYPTIEVAPSTPRTSAYLAHNAIPIQLTEDDLNQVLAGNFVRKVIYLPDPEFQGLALGTPETLVSTRLDVGQDPIKEADRRGAIMAIIRVGNKDVELPGVASGQVVPATFEHNPLIGAQTGAPLTLGQSGLMPRYVAGVTAPQYGMPSSGTPIGLPGPPHIPFGAPAGLQMHVMRNHTGHHIPEPVDTFKIHVKQQPGFSYPLPPNRMYIREQMIHPPQYYSQPHHNMQMRAP